MTAPTRTLDSQLNVFRDPIRGAATNPLVRALDWILRGVGQVVFQSNWMTGIIILIGIGVNSPIYLLAAILGTAVSTFTAVALKVDRGLVDAGLMGFNGCLAGIGMAFYMSDDVTNGDWPSGYLWIYIVVCAAFTTVILSAIASLLGSRKVPTLTAPFVFATWIFLFAVYAFKNLEPGALLSPSLPSAMTEASSYTFETFWNGTFKGVGEIFFQDNWVTGLIMAVGVLVNSRIGGLMCVGGPALAALIAMAFGASEGTINAGLYGFNASLTAIAIGGFFFVLNRAGALYTLFGVIVTSFVWPTIGTFLKPIGMPTLTFPFVLVTWIFLIAKPGFMAVTPVAPADATFPEDNYRRWRSGELASGT